MGSEETSASGCLDRAAVVAKVRVAVLEAVPVADRRAELTARCVESLRAMSELIERAQTDLVVQWLSLSWFGGGAVMDMSLT